MSRAIRATLLAFVGCAGLAACAGRQAPPSAAPDAIAGNTVRRFDPHHDGKPIVDGISYGPYREGQRPGGPDPSRAQIREDLHIIARHWPMLRIYSSRGPARELLEVIREDELPLKVVVGAWIDPTDTEANDAEVRAAIELANGFPAQVVAVSVGNETQVFWSGHRTDPGIVLGALRQVRTAVAQPVTTADDYNFWNKPESKAFAAEVDFILLHAYAMWNGQSLDDAVQWTANTVHSIREFHPNRKIVLGETGWATTLNPDGDETQHIRAPAGEAEQARFYAEFTAWARADGLPYFYFEAFDEPWKGSADPREVEKHWGLYRVDRTPKEALEGAGRADE